MIRSTKVSIRFTNRGKQEKLSIFLAEYRRVLSDIVNMIWEEKKIPVLLPKQYTGKVKTWLSARAIQCAGKQASAIVRGAKKKHEQRLWKLTQMQKEGADTKDLECLISKKIPTKPNIKWLPAELDGRFVTFDLQNSTSFDGWMNLGSLGNGLKISLPFRRHKHFNRLFAKGAMTKGIRLGNEATLTFQIPVVTKTTGNTLGVDIGLTNCIATSDGKLSGPDIHGHTLISITKKLTRCRKGSRGFKRCATHRKNHINWVVNQLNLNGIRELRRENIKHLRRGRLTSRLLSHWTYSEIVDKLDKFCEEQGVLVRKINPAYTSQRCSACNTLGQRRGQVFTCSCGSRNADLNAALNIGESIVSRENVFL